MVEAHLALEILEPRVRWVRAEARNLLLCHSGKCSEVHLHTRLSPSRAARDSQGPRDAPQIGERRRTLFVVIRQQGTAQ